jgi:hypothetical protein
MIGQTLALLDRGEPGDPPRPSANAHRSLK